MKFRTYSLNILLLVALSLFVFSCSSEASEKTSQEQKTEQNKAEKVDNKKKAKKKKATPKLPAFETLKKSKAGTLIIPGKINGKKVKENETLVIKSDKMLIDGWAIDKLRERTAGGVYIQWDNKKITPISYGFSRPDVAKYLKDKKYTKTGFKTSVPVTRLGKGEHTYKFYVLSADKKNYYASTKSYKVDIK